MLFADGVATKVKNHKELFWFTLGCTFLFGLLAHGYCYFNIMYSHDSLMVYQDNAAEQMAVGRFMAPLYFILRGYFYTPSLIGVLSLLFLGLATYLMLRLCKMEKKLFVVLTCGILVTNTAMTLLHATYMHDVDRYMCSLLLAVLGVYLVRTYRWGLLVAPWLIGFSLGLYQSYFQVAVLLVMILAVLDILDGKSFTEVFVNGIKGLIVLILGLVLYYIGAKIVPVLAGVPLMDNYNGLNNVGNYGGIADMIALVSSTYQYIGSYFLYPVTGHSSSAGILNIALFAALLGMIVYVVKRCNVRKENVLLLCVVLALMPFGANVIHFISHGFQHNLMIFSFFVLYLFFLAVFERMAFLLPAEESCPFRCKELYVPHCVILAVFVWMLLGNVMYANQMYQQKELEYQNTLLTMNRIVDRIEQTDGYVVGETPVALVGTLQRSEVSLARTGFDKVSVGNSQNFAVTYYQTYENYFEELIAYPINLLEEEDSAQWAKHPAVMAMPSFPYQGFCKIIDGTLVVKLSQ